MPFDCVVEHDRRLVVLRGTKRHSIVALPVKLAQVLKDEQGIGLDYRLLVVVDVITVDAAADSRTQAAMVFGTIRSRFRRMALVALEPAQALQATMVAVAADPGQAHLRAFMLEPEALNWVLDDAG